MDPVTIAVIVVVAAVLWAAFSPDPLAKALRSRFRVTKKDAAEMIADARTLAQDAEILDAKQEQQARRELYEVDQLIATNEVTRDRLAGEIADKTRLKQLAFDKQNKTAFDAAVAALDGLNVEKAGIDKALEGQYATRKRLSGMIDKTEKAHHLAQAQAHVAVGDVIANTTVAKAEEAQAGLTKAESGDDDRKKLDAMRDATEARRRAADVAADGATDADKAQHALDDLAQQAGATDADAEWKRMKAEAASKQ